jgi:FlaA1/EpsC-like NDP-sugar epimerase
MSNRRFGRANLVFLHDLTMAAASFVLSLYLRVGDSILFYKTSYLATGAGLFVAIAAVVFWGSKLYGGVWRYASLNDLWAIAKASTITVLVFFLLMFLMTRLEDLPRSMPFINWFVLMALLGGPRFLYRLAKDRRLDLEFHPDGRRRIPVLLVGAGDAADLFLRSLTRDSDSAYRAVGMLSLTDNRVGREIHGVPVLGTVEDIEAAVTKLTHRHKKPQRLVLTRDDIDPAIIRRLLEKTEALGMTLARLPKLTEFKQGLEDHLEIRPVSIEDLLGRPQAVLDRELMRGLIAGRRVLITGAGGTIGGELVRQVADFEPAQLTLLDNSEFNLYSIELELSERKPEMPRAAMIADVRDQRRIEEIWAELKPEVVFHAAALKHVPMVEAHPLEGIMTNALGTRTVADACRRHGVKAMVLISTDKAVNPTNIMGATKRIAERYCQALDLLAETHYVTVRFGNVLGSTGSVVPLFQRQLARGGPLTVTHPEITRFFMTVREAVELVLEASALGLKHPEHQGKIFVLDMGEPVRIADLARQMIRLAGLRPEKDVAIAYTGLRPGEKLYEEVLHEAESTVATEIKGILIASPRGGEYDEMAKALDDLAAQAIAGDKDRALALLSELVPEYREPEHHR